MARPETFIVDGEGWSDEKTDEVCRRILTALAPRAHVFECDIPGDPEKPADWPAPEVATAARLLRSFPNRRRRIENDSYAGSGDLPAEREDLWAAFVTFAPHAFDATVWDIHGHAIVYLADEAQSIVVRLTPDQVNELATIVGADRLIPYRKWSRIRRERRKAKS
jgi:hypothetical protein